MNELLESIIGTLERNEESAELRIQAALQLAYAAETSLARRDVEKKAEGALAIRHLTKGDDWEDDELRAVIDDYVAGLLHQAEEAK